jgi:hypothetical protein
VLDAEEARTRLVSIADPVWREAALRRVKKLRRAHRGLAVLLVPDGPRDPREAAELRRGLRAAAVALDELDTDRRTAVMSALHPRLGPALARWWVDAQGQPYQQGWLRRAFRAPHDPELTRLARLDTLRQVLQRTGPYDRDAVWLAAWAPHLGREQHGGAPSLAQLFAGPVLAAAIDAGGRDGEEVFATLLAIGRGEHPVGVVDRHVVVGLARASRPDGWEFLERVLLAAQRQEGLRQTILEAIDEAHPDCFDRMLEVIVREDLTRFAATVRAVCVWLGFSADVQEIPLVRDRVGQLRALRADAVAREQAAAGEDPWSTYLALCAQAMRDVVPAVSSAEHALAHPDPGVRAASIRFLGATQHPHATRRLAVALGDPDLAVAALAHASTTWRTEDDPVAIGLLGPSRTLAPPDTFERLERLAARLPERDRPTPAIGVEQQPIVLSRSAVVASLLTTRGARSWTRLATWWPTMDAATRQRFLMELQRGGTPPAELRGVLLTAVGDRSSWVRGAAVDLLAKTGVVHGEAPAIEALLTRKASDLRRGVLRLLLTQRLDDVVRSAERLWATGEAAPRDAACELLRGVERPSRQVATAARAFAADGATPRQRELLGALVGDVAVSGSDEPGLGLFDPARRTPAVAPPRPKRGARFGSDAARRIVGELDDLAEAHRDVQLSVLDWRGTREVLLADAQWLPSPFAPGPAGHDGDEQEGRGLVLPEVFRGWWAERPARCRDDKELDALRALAALAAPGRRRDVRQWAPEQPRWWSDLLVELAGGPVGELRHRPVVHHVLLWLLADDLSPAVVDEALDAHAATLALIPADVVAATPAPHEIVGGWITAAEYARRWSGEWRPLLRSSPWDQVLRGASARRPDLFDAGRIGRWFRLERWVQEPRSGAASTPIFESLLLAAHAAGAATDDDVLAALLQPRSPLLTAATRRRRDRLATEFPGAVALADRVRDRVIDLERTRGDLTTAASGPALCLGSTSGAALAIELLGRLGRASLVRGHLHGQGRETVTSHLLRVSHPAPADDGASLRTTARSAGVSDARLVELAVFAPQWAAIVEQALEWDGFEDAVWWIHAHTKDSQWSVPPEVREDWAVRAAERTPLSAADLLDGAVDVEWFSRCHAALGAKRWAAVHRSAKLASGGNGHRRAQIFAESMRGDIEEAALVERIVAKRHQDGVRALGLLPLPDDGEARSATLQRRYATIREFERGAAKFGSQRQASERTAARIAVENLARSAGYADPQRFVWAMEAAEAGPLADGPIVVTEGDVTATLSITAEGTPDLVFRRGEKALRAAPAALRKVAAIADVRARATALTKQASRVRAALEAAMVRQERLAEDDFAALDRHPVLAPMLRQVVLVDDDGTTLRRGPDGYVDADGSPRMPTGPVRIAHPVDLMASGRWPDWQARLVVDGRRQPFKQAFRELYVLTEPERAIGPSSRRYEGHQVQPRQATALLGRRGWMVDREGGDVTRVFHHHSVVVHLDLPVAWGTPADVDLPTLGAVTFSRRGACGALPLESVPPVVFSEAMRDVDLVVSVADAGGVDPEATASTVEMRAALVRETARVLRLDNVREVGAHVVIDGTLGEYSVHLGSGVVHRRPGGALCIVPVDAQRRGRIFLPFADDDPKTAEVVAKVLLLARDREIRDPTILSQLQS